jgi:glycosyltransferase involved in cell wall biosynthesis
MRIAVNTRFLLSSKMEGFGWYTFETFKRITQQHPEHEFIFLFDRPYDKKFIFSSNITPVVIGPQARHPFLQLIWFNRSVTKALKKYKAHVFISPDGYLSLRTNIPQLAVIHDLNFEHFPAFLPFWPRWFYLKYFPKYARKAKRIVTVSEFSKKDIISQYGIQGNKIDVSLNGASEIFQPTSPEEQQLFRNTYTQGHPYYLFVGALHPRKNPETLFKAYEMFRNVYNKPYRLLVVGEKYYWTNQARKTYESMQHRNEVIFTGHLSQKELVHAYGAARALVFPSFFEGFGIPLVESMRCGTPVLCSNETSLPEVGGDAAAYFFPDKPEQLTQQMKKLAEEDGLRSFMSMKSLERAQIFSWNKTAAALWKSIETMAHAEGLL